MLSPRGGSAVPGTTQPPAGRARPRGAARRGPSLARELMQMVLLQPELVRSIPLPRPEDGTAEGAALSALVDFCLESEGPVTTAAVLQRFADTPHDAVLSAALASAQDQALAPELAEAQLREGVRRWWVAAQRDGRAGPPPDEAPELTAEEGERLRQLELVRRGTSGGSASGAGR